MQNVTARLLGILPASALLFFFCLGPAPGFGYELGFSYKDTSVDSVIASRKAMQPDGYAIGLFCTFEPIKHTVAELGYDMFIFKSVSSLSGGTVWYETDNDGYRSYGYPIAADQTTIVAHGMHGQVGFRYEFVKERNYGWVAWADASVGYQGIFKITRQSGEVGDYTNRVAERMSLRSAAYLQPRFALLWVKNEKSHGGLTASYERYLDSDLAHSWTIGLVFEAKY
jgi:hypothetical protein